MFRGNELILNSSRHDSKKGDYANMPYGYMASTSSSGYYTPVAQITFSSVYTAMYTTLTGHIPNIYTLTYISRKEVVYNGNLLELKKPLELELISNNVNNNIEINNEKLGLYAFANTFKKAIEIIDEKLEMLYEEYVEDNSIEFTKDAIELRDKIKSYFQ